MSLQEFVMPVYLIGKKLGMTQLFAENGNAVPVTVIEAGPCPVVQLKTDDNDKYQAIQLGFIDKKEKNVTKPLAGHYKKAGVSPKSHLKESRIDDTAEYSVGQEVKVDIFEKGDYVDIIGRNKGKGFTGVVKRWGFRGGKQTHGSKNHRTPGAIGNAATPARVFKGKKMPGQMGNVRQTMQDLEVIDVRVDENQLFVKGAVPGAVNSIVYIRKAKKKSKEAAKAK